MKEKLIKEAKKVAGNFILNAFDGKSHSAGVVGCALLADNNKIYTGISLKLNCGVDFCAEASAIAEMLKDRISKIKMLVAVIDNGTIVPPCGRCREMMAQINNENQNTEIIISDTQTKTLKELLPYNWMDSF